MNPFFRRFLPVLAAAIALAAEARAERIFPVNDNVGGTRVFDQPSVAANGNTIHVAFVGNNAGVTDNTLLYYAAVNGAADFTSLSTTDNQVFVTRAVAIDNGAYSQARHPQIAVRSANQLVILFQAKPDRPNEDYKLFRALVTIDNNAVKTQVVHEIKDSSGLSFDRERRLTDPSFGIVTSDNTARVAYVDNTVDVYYARVGLDNALLVRTPIWLTNPLLAASRGVLPLPRLRLDGLNRSHVVWAANNNDNMASGVYYALVNQPSTGADNLAIGATPVLASGYRWGFPNVLVAANSRILVLAADEPFGPNDDRGIAGSIGVSLLNPDGIVQTGLPVNTLGAGSNASFFLSPPGQAVLAPNFDAYRPEAALDASNHVYVAGYGTLSGEFLPSVSLRGTPGRFYGMTVSGVTTTTGATAEIAQMASSPLPVGNGDFAFAGTIPDDYTRPAFARFSGKSVLFWSGPEVSGGGRNLYVTSVSSSADPVPTPTPAKQSGCSVVANPHIGEAGRIPGAVALFLPAAILLLRRIARKGFAR